MILSVKKDKVLLRSLYPLCLNRASAGIMKKPRVVSTPIMMFGVRRIARSAHFVNLNSNNLKFLFV